MIDNASRLQNHWCTSGGVRHGGWPVYVNGHRSSIWPMTAREWPTLDIRSGAV